jgi:hypothetical protein
MVPIQAMSKHNIDLPLPITLGEYNAIAHLTYIMDFTDRIEPYVDVKALRLNVAMCTSRVVTSKQRVQVRLEPKSGEIIQDNKTILRGNGEWSLQDRWYSRVRKYRG